MRKLAVGLGWILAVIGGALIMLGIAAWPPGGLMFALPFVFLVPGLALAAVGGILVWLGHRHHQMNSHHSPPE